MQPTDFLVDLGFNGMITISRDKQSEFGAPTLNATNVRTVNGRASLNTCVIWINIGGENQEVEAYVTDDLNSIGTFLLEGHKLSMKIVKQGHFVII